VAKYFSLNSNFAKLPSREGLGVCFISCKLTVDSLQCFLDYILFHPEASRQQSTLVDYILSFSLMKKKQKIKTWDFRRSKWAHFLKLKNSLAKAGQTVRVS
jgi:hypothetical protein